MKRWSFSYTGGVRGEWPLDNSGEMTAPAFLERVPGDNISVELERNMLASFGIASVCKYVNNGELGLVVMGNAGCGVDIYVPETLLDDAKNLISGDIAAEGAENAPGEIEENKEEED